MKPQEIHGDGNCHICGKPMAGKGSDYCSYPHGMVPVEEVGAGMWAWEPHVEPIGPDPDPPAHVEPVKSHTRRYGHE